MFGLFGSRLFHDEQLGELTRSRGHWRGSLTLEPGAQVPLVLSGSRSQPDARAVTLARELPGQFPAWRAGLEQALFEHYQPYAELEDGPSLSAPDQVWPHVSWVFLCVRAQGAEPTVELGCEVSWDEEHTLGASFQAGRLLELSGSVLPP